ncbi:hypothetical protein FACS189461_4460 [Spirochaetia bacterium]|nr:hypothetical protein FACS189461_4460 [Spirochaetia bacterium]
MAMTNINVRTDSEIKARAQQIFESMGLDMSTAVNIFLRQTVRQNDLPFVLTAKPRAAMFGCLRGKYVMADDFDAPLDDFYDTNHRR